MLRVVDLLLRVVGGACGKIIASGVARRFLRRTAILTRLCGGSCDRVTGHSGSAVLLAELERTNLLLTPLDIHREWFRYHYLFGELLLGELERVEPALVTELHRWMGRREEAQRAAAEHDVTEHWVCGMWTPPGRPRTAGPGRSATGNATSCNS